MCEIRSNERNGNWIDLIAGVKLLRIEDLKFDVQLITCISNRKTEHDFTPLD